MTLPTSCWASRWVTAGNSTTLLVSPDVQTLTNPPERKTSMGGSDHAEPST